MSSYNYTKANNPVKLDGEIRSSSIGSVFDGLSTSGTSIITYFTQDLTADQQSTLNGIIAAHTTSYPNATVAASLSAAANFGMGMINNYKVQNVLAGITQSGQTQAIADVLMNLNYYLGTGSLYAALN